MAKLHFKYGAMNSGKSDTLIKTAYNYTEQSLRIVVVKPVVDTKGGRYVSARAGGRWRVDMLAAADDDLLAEIVRRHNNAPLSCVLVDEAQFLTPDQIDQLFTVAKRHDISVICYGLRADFRRQLFPGSARLLELADNIEKLPTMCRCGSQAEFNCRKVDGEGQVTYDSLCGCCYLDEHDRLAVV